MIILITNQYKYEQDEISVDDELFAGKEQNMNKQDTLCIENITKQAARLMDELKNNSPKLKHHSTEELVTSSDQTGLPDEVSKCVSKSQCLLTCH